MPPHNGRTEIAAVFYTLLETAKIAGIDPARSGQRPPAAERGKTNVRFPPHRRARTAGHRELLGDPSV